MMAGIPAMKAEYETAIRERAWPVAKFAKTETLQDSPAACEARVKAKKRARGAAYELALRSDREYRAGDHLSYYVTGQKKSVSVVDHARLATEWDPAERDENVVYYAAKLDALYKKFGPPAQGELL